ncbi:MAG TPA: MFS transporter [Kineosporiaceae bacterium]|nr:MFS transporter [Kineosporiaceae bacterium]
MTPPVDPRRWWALVVIAIAQLMVILDSTVVNIALPSAQRALDISVADRQWIITAYTLTFGGLMLLGGRIADFFGRKRAFMIGLVGFAAASALGGAATNGATLFGARALQGVFGALLAPAALSLITVTFTESKERARAFGVYGAVSGGGGAIGLIAGGLLTEYSTWRWCLFVNVPIALIAVIAAIPLVRESHAEGERHYDVPGAVLATTGLAALVYGFTKAATDGWSAGATVAWLVSAVVVLAAFTAWEARTAYPLLPLRVVADRNRGASFLISVLISAALLGMFLFMTFFLQQSLGYSALRSGIAYLPFSAGIIIAAGFAAQFLPRLGPRIIMGAGGILATASMAWLIRLDLDSTYATAVLPSFIAMGLGIGLIFVPLSNTALIGVDDQDAGVASAMVNSTQQVGGSLGTALLNTIFTTAVANYLISHGTGPAQQAHGAIHAYNVAFTASTALAAAATILVLFVRGGTNTASEDPGLADTQGRAPIPAL